MSTPEILATPIEIVETVETVEPKKVKKVETPLTREELKQALRQAEDAYKLMKTSIPCMKKALKSYDPMKPMKKSRKKREENPNKPKRKPSGFANPTMISDALCEFLGKTKDTEVPRTTVTQSVILYIKDNHLQIDDNKRAIDLTKPGGEKLRKLLDPPADKVTGITFFEIQSYLAPHFPISWAKKKGLPIPERHVAPVVAEPEPEPEPVVPVPEPVVAAPAPAAEPKKRVIVRRKKVPAA